MRRRRFFRGLTLTLLLLCVGAWGWSRAYFESLNVMPPTGMRSIILRDGKVDFVVWHIGRHSTLYWSHMHSSRDETRVAPLERTNWALLGFQYHGPRPGDPVVYYWLTVPLWFPTLLLTALTAWAWRKRRSEGERGFAVGQGQLREESGEKRE